MNAWLERTFRIWVPIVLFFAIGMMGITAVTLAQHNFRQALIWGVGGFGIFIPVLWWLIGAAAREIAETKGRVTDLLVSYGVEPTAAPELLMKLQTEMRGITVR